MSRPALPAHRCTVTDADVNPCIRGRHHTGPHHFLVPRRRRQPVALLAVVSAAERALDEKRLVR